MSRRMARKRPRRTVDVRAADDDGILSPQETTVVVNSCLRAQDRGVSNPGNFKIQMPTAGMGCGQGSLELISFTCSNWLSPIPFKNESEPVEMVVNYTSGLVPESFVFPDVANAAAQQERIVDFTPEQFRNALNQLVPAGVTFSLATGFGGSVQRQLEIDSTIWPITFDLRDVDPSDPVNHVYRMMGLPFGKRTQFLSTSLFPLPMDLGPYAKNLYISVSGCANSVRSIAQGGTGGVNAAFVVPVRPSWVYWPPNAARPPTNPSISWEARTDAQRQAGIFTDPEGQKQITITDHSGRPVWCDGWGSGQLVDWTAVFRVTYG